MGLFAEVRMPSLRGRFIFLTLFASMASQCYAINPAKTDAVGEALRALEVAIRGSRNPEFNPPHQRRSAPRKIPRLDDIGDAEYLDFPEEPPILQDLYRSPSKRYLGIEIPDYVSGPSKGSLLKTISNRMKEAGKRK